MGVEDTIRDAFNEAKLYKASWDEYQAKVAKGERPIPPRKDLKLEALKEVLEGKRFVHAHCYRADEILMLLRVADDYGFKIKTLQHVLEGYKVAKEIAAHGAGASTFSDWWSYKVEAFDAIPYNAGHHDPQGRDGQHQQRRCRVDAASQHGSREVDEVWRADARRGAGDGNAESGEATGDRQSRGID
jgi:hypothetical protein